MASGPGDASVQHQRYTESKVYTRKSHGKNHKQPPSNNAVTQQTPQQPPPQQTQTQNQKPTQTNDPPPVPPPAPVRDDVSSTHRDAPAEPAEAAEPSPVKNPENQPIQVSDDEASSLNHGTRVSGQNGVSRSVTINLSSQSRQELRDLKRKLTGELEQVRILSKRLEVADTAAAISAAPPSVVPETGYTQSQFSATDPETPVARQPSSKRGPDLITTSASAVPMAAPTPAPVMTPTFPASTSVQFRRQLSVSVSGTDNFPTESFEKEKRTPKANQLYRNSEFLLAKDRIPPPESNKKSKSGSKKHSLSGDDYNSTEKKLYSSAFKKCSALLARLMKHKFGWVFNKPVDPVALGLHDYLTIIKHPMDLGTIKTRLSMNWYKSPREFAEDVRLTFRNAMTYNPKGQDVHFMAEQLNQVFEEGWSSIDAEMSYHHSYHSPPPIPPKKPAASAPAPMLERSDSTLHPQPGNYAQVQVPAPLPPVGRSPALKKPKAKDPHKRDMTFEEKRRLSNNLQNLPPEKLDVIVQIIKRKNLSLSQHDDEIEVDIDSMDAETLWELDRFVTNYKKNLSKNKRKAELAMLARRDLGQVAQKTVQERVVEEPAPGEASNRADDNYVATSGAPTQVENKGENPSRSSSSSSSSSDSGSSSSDSDSDSSSAYGSDGGAQ